MSKSDYRVNTVYYNNLDSGEYTTKGKSFKSFQEAVKNFDLLWDSNGDYIGSNSGVLTVLQHLVCSLKHYKYNQSSKKLLKNMFLLITSLSIVFNEDDVPSTCAEVKQLLKSAEDFIH
tara:strand:+ start:330 stop:683 length:354 start_codon:yes stop_codon:yes gene_type:complete